MHKMRDEPYGVLNVVAASGRVINVLVLLI